MFHEEKYSTQEFFDRLRSNDLGTQSVLFGKTKLSDNKNELLFAFKGDNENWISIPAKQIEHVHYIRSFTKEGEKIALVKIHFKAPSNPDAKMFSDLLFALGSKVMKWHIKKMLMHEKMEEGMGMDEHGCMMHKCGCAHHGHDIK